MSDGIERRSFLRGNFKKRNKSPLRPPWSLPEAEFTVACTKCGDCLEACPETILVADGAGFPRIDFKQGGCTFCGDCRTACETGAIAKEDTDSQVKLPVVARVKDDCLAVNGTTCRVCAYRCMIGAISFRFRPGGIEVIDLDQGACTGCGACFAPCPVDAIEIIHRIG